MRRMVASAAVRTPQKSVLTNLDSVKGRAVKILPDSEPVRIDQNHTIESDKLAFLALIDEARIRAGLSQKEMAITAAVAEGAFCEALKGQRGNFAIHWLANQRPAFWQAFLKILSQRFHLTEERQEEIDADRIGELVSLLIKNTRRSQ